MKSEHIIPGRGKGNGFIEIEWEVWDTFASGEEGVHVWTFQEQEVAEEFLVRRNEEIARQGPNSTPVRSVLVKTTIKRRVIR